MSVETAADRAVFFNAAEFGVLADYVSPDNSTTVPGITILIDDRIDGKPEQSGRTVTAGHVISVRVSEVPAPAKDGRFVVGSAAHVIVGKPFLDDGGTIWMCMTA